MATNAGGSKSGAAELVITHMSDKLMMATFDHVCIAVWEIKPTRELFEIQRSHLAKVVAAHPGRAGCACVIEGGFRAAITPTVLTGIMLVVRLPSPFVFLESAPAAAHWLETKIAHRELAGLVEQIERARGQMKH